MIDGNTWKLEQPHVEGCHAVATVERGDWDTPWWYPYFERKEPVRLDSLGRRTRYPLSGRRWIRLHCNSTRCDATLLVREDVLTEAVPSNPTEKTG